MYNPYAIQYFPISYLVIEIFRSSSPDTLVNLEYSDVLLSSQILIDLGFQYRWHPFIVVPGDLISMNKQTPVFPDTLATYQLVREVFHHHSTLFKSTPHFT